MLLKKLGVDRVINYKKENIKDVSSRLLAPFSFTSFNFFIWSQAYLEGLFGTYIWQSVFRFQFMGLIFRCLHMDFMCKYNSYGSSGCSVTKFKLAILRMFHRFGLKITKQTSFIDCYITASAMLCHCWCCVICINSSEYEKDYVLLATHYESIHAVPFCSSSPLFVWLLVLSFSSHQFISSFICVELYFC